MVVTAFTIVDLLSITVRVKSFGYSQDAYNSLLNLCFVQFFNYSVPFSTSTFQSPGPNFVYYLFLSVFIQFSTKALKKAFLVPRLRMVRPKRKQSRDIFQFLYKLFSFSVRYKERRKICGTWWLIGGFDPFRPKFCVFKPALAAT